MRPSGLRARERKVAPIIIFVVAAAINAYHAGTILLIVESYPEAIRSTGFGWAFGVGRIGASGAPVLAGLLLGVGWSPVNLFIAATLPGFATRMALVGLSMVLVRGPHEISTRSNLRQRRGMLTALGCKSGINSSRIPSLAPLIGNHPLALYVLS
jgi:hypothetical protein